VAIPLGSSSDAPVMRPGPSHPSQDFRDFPLVFVAGIEGFRARRTNY
jgi:hypothetical protein